MKSLIKICIISLFLLGINSPVIAQSPEDLFLEAMMKQEGEGNLNEAIEIYSELVNDPKVQRSIQAKALLQMGDCYEKLGQKKAAAAYEKLIAEYGDQKALIAVAKSKLKSLKGNFVPKNHGLMSERIVKGIMSGIMLHRVSPDGRFCSFLDTRPPSKHAEEIVRYDFQSKKMIPVTEGHVEVFGERNSMPWNSIWSPDGKKIAYSYYNKEAEDVTKFEVHLVNVNGGEKEVVYSVPTDEWGGVEDFSHDGQKILLSLASPRGAERGYVKLIEVSIASKEGKELMKFESEPRGFRYDPNGRFVSYYDSNGIYTFNVNSKQIEQIISDGMDWSPIWNLQGDKLLFLSDRYGTNDLFYVEMEEGKSVGVPKSLKRHLGEGVNILGMDTKGEVYVMASNSRKDIYTASFTSEMDIDKSSINQITPPERPSLNGAARFSKDGKYISYQSRIGNLNPDEELGFRYGINIYNTETESTKFLDLPLYMNHYPRSQRWMVPSWSYHANELLVHARVRENFEGGFFIIDVEKESYRPALTKPNCKQGMARDEVEMGNSMFFSRKKDVIYFSENGWKRAMQYNLRTKELKPIAEIEDGFWFLGFWDLDETKVFAANRYGIFEYDIHTHRKVKFADGAWDKVPLFVNQTKGFKLYNLESEKVFTDVLSNVLYEKNLKVVFDSGEFKLIELGKLFSESFVDIQDFNSEKNQLLLSVEKNPGREIYRLSNVFEL